MPAPLPRFLTACLIFFLASMAAPAELPRPVERPAIPKIHSLAHKAGYIFSGTVKSVERIAPNNASSVPVMRITFQVDKGYVGVRSGQQLVIHECAGLWQSGESYRRGEKVLLFLYPLSKLGLTSPVGGMSGRFAMDRGGRIVILPGQMGIGPSHTPTPVEEAPTRILLRPEDFVRALRAALEN
ncbi:MAG TPA: hypothetical protein VEH30_14930 [Terriglobales bacterium]|nr:hypothetical protein [Terriglobales bacterium]